jgi:micrococcal nuclease
MNFPPLAALAVATLVLTGCASPGARPVPSTVPNPEATAHVLPETIPLAPAPAPGTYRVDRVVDGDTVRIWRDGKSVPLRLIGGDTPETVHPNQPVQCYGLEASAEAKRLLTGKRVEIIYDPSQGRVDAYQRDLVYVELPDGTDFMEHMVATGHAREYRYRKDYQRMPQYRAAQTEAREAGRGLWGACPRTDR